VLIGTDTARELRRVALDTVAVRLPTQAGEYPVTVVMPGFHREVGTISVRGYRGEHESVPAPGGEVARR
jgi:hypothetical protein